MQLLLKRLHALKFPKIDRTKMQDGIASISLFLQSLTPIHLPYPFSYLSPYVAEFIAIADAASDTIREIDNIKDDDPRYFEAFEYLHIYFSLLLLLQFSCPLVRSLLFFLLDFFFDPLQLPAKHRTCAS